MEWDQITLIQNSSQAIRVKIEKMSFIIRVNRFNNYVPTIGDVILFFGQRIDHFICIAISKIICFSSGEKKALRHCSQLYIYRVLYT